MSQDTHAGGHPRERRPQPRAESAPDRDASSRQARIAFAVLGALTLYVMLPFLSGLIGGPILYVAGLPLHRWLAPKIGARRSALACAIVALILVIGPIALLVTSIAGRVPDIIRGIEGSEEFKRLLTLHVGTLDLGAHVRTFAGSTLAWFSSQTPAWIGNVTRSMINLLLALFGFYYLLRSDDASWSRLKRTLPVSDATAETLRARFHDATTAVLLDVALTATLQGSVVGVAFAVVGLPDPLFWGAITACASLLPVLGSALVWMPGAVVLALEQRYGAALTLALVGAIVASNIDNLARLVVFKHVANIHPFVTLAGAFAGLNAFGIVGLLLGPLLLSFLIELMRSFERAPGTSPAGSA